MILTSDSVGKNNHSSTGITVMKYRMQALQDFEIGAGIIGTFLCVLWIARLLAMSTFVADGDGQVQIFGQEQLCASYHCTAVVVFTVY